jgi:hypothetical protein
MRPLVQQLREFVHSAFDHSISAKARFWPNLEDLFTNIDLAANTGHHLGPDYAPARLRTMRRLLLARMMMMLDERYTEAESGKADEASQLDRFFRKLDVDQSAFISINWDTVIERGLAGCCEIERFEYGCDAHAATFPRSGNIISERGLSKESAAVPVVKIHGSVNWLYCDNCRQLYWFRPEDAI